jgi:hypothetical protein
MFVQGNYIIIGIRFITDSLIISPIMIASFFILLYLMKPKKGHVKDAPAVNGEW